ncbi:hypothetical protein DUNSADRAFT_9036, partial [Dunaliella salina]
QPLASFEFALFATFFDFFLTLISSALFDSALSCCAAISESEEEEAAFEAAKQSVRGLRALIAAGVVHRQVVDGLVSCEAPSLESFEWLRQVRHYWDNETDVLYVAFAQTRLPYGFEYNGREVDAAFTTAPLSVPGLLAAVNALQTSPIVTLALGGGQGGGWETVSALSTIVGKFAASVEFGPDTTETCSARLLLAALASDSWLAVDGVHKLNLQVLSCFSQQLQEVWSAFFYGSTNIMLPIGRGSLTGLIPSPWAKPIDLDTPAPCSLFVSLPMASSLSPSHSVLLDAQAIGSSQLNQNLRQLSRAVMIAPPSFGLTLEICLRDLGLRDAAEAARAVACCFNLAAMQLPPRPQYNFGLLLVRSLVAFVREQWLSGSFTPSPSTPTSLSRDNCGSPGQPAPSPLDIGNAIDAVDAALHAVLMRIAHPDDAPLLSRLAHQVTSGLPRTMPPTGTPAAPPPLPRAPSTFLSLSAADIYASGSSAGGGPLESCQGSERCLPSTDSIKQRLEQLVAAAAGAEHRRIQGGNELLQGAALGHQGLSEQGHVRRMEGFAQDAYVRATQEHPRAGGSSPHRSNVLPLPPQCHRTGLPWTAMHPTWLERAVLDLATQLCVCGTVLLVGPAGVGKSLAWKALVAAVSGEAALSYSAAPALHAHPHPPLVHCYTEALSLPASALGGYQGLASSCATRGVGDGPEVEGHEGVLPAASGTGSRPPKSGLEAWLQTVLEGLEPQHVCTRAREETADAVEGAMAGGAGSAAAAAPSSAALTASSFMPRIQVVPATRANASEWVVLDGPLNSLASEILLPLVVGARSKTAGASSVACAAFVFCLSCFSSFMACVAFCILFPCRQPLFPLKNVCRHHILSCFSSFMACVAIVFCLSCCISSVACVAFLYCLSCSISFKVTVLQGEEGLHSNQLTAS